jgi:hypothetical protein
LKKYEVKNVYLSMVGVVANQIARISTKATNAQVGR